MKIIKYFFVIASAISFFSMYSSTHFEIKEKYDTERLLTVKWLWRLEDRLDHIENIENKIDAYQILLQWHIRELESDKFGARFFSAFGISFVAVMTSMILDTRYCSDLISIIHENKEIVAVSAGLCGLICYLCKYCTDSCDKTIEYDKSIIQKLENLRNKSDAQKTLCREIYLR